MHEGTEYRLRKSVGRIRNGFSSRKLKILRWIPGRINITDALAKRNFEMYEKLNIMCADGVLNVDLAEGVEIDGDSWK